MTLRELPSVHEVLLELAGESRRCPHPLLVALIRETIGAARDSLLAGRDVPRSIAETVRQSLARFEQPSLRSVINATGVILHTNLGRAPLDRIEIPAGYTNLEYDLTTGKRGRRDVHTGRLLDAILGAPSVVVNNNAAALFLILNEVAAGGEVIVSRGELIEIGDGFRIPEILQRSGASLREVGATNRTHIDDYRDAIGERTRLLLRVHPSNFRMSGFTARPSLEDLVRLGRERGIPVCEDLGSGCLVDLRESGIAEPLAQASLAAGADLICFSGDKLLGGPQAGIIAGESQLVRRLRRNPLFRALRKDKLFYAAMEPVLRHLALGEYDAIPALRMIRMPADAIRLRAEAVAARIGSKASVRAGESVAGGGSTPDMAIPTWLIVIENGNPVELEGRLRASHPPIVARIERDRLVLDLRTVFPEEEDAIVQALS